ncbi:MAG: hypothetical protein II351_01120, partial [Clostridia bacterium]|nr:hypothetical protein [Clostridia bacterium]
EAMIDRLIRIFMECGADEIVIITNNLSPIVKDHLQSVVDSEVVRKNVRFVFADKVETVLKTALLPKSASGKQPISVKQSTFTALHQ